MQEPEFLGKDRHMSIGERSVWAFCRMPQAFICLAPEPLCQHQESRNKAFLGGDADYWECGAGKLTAVDTC